MRFLLLLLAVPLLALDNSVTVSDAATTTHTARPVVIHRWFARGEIASYAKPRVGGVVPTAWQCDVTARWDDGSVRLAYVSWRQSITSGGSVTADFVNDTNRSSAGNDSATNAAALDQAGMLAFDTGGGSGSWNGIIEGTLNSISYTANAKTMLTAGTWRYYLRGPVVTWAIAEDQTTALSHDFGWQYTGGAWQAPSGDQYKSLHPIIMVQFWPAVGAFSAWPGVEIDAILWNASTTRLQRIPLDKLRVLTGASGTTESYCAGTGCSVTSAGTPNMIARRTWHTVQWSGTAPSKVLVDYNLAYMVYSRALLPYDPSIPFTENMTTAELSTITTNLGSTQPEFCDPAGGRCSSWMKYMPNTGGRNDIGPIPAAGAYALYSMGSSWSLSRKIDIWEKFLLGNADAGGVFPMHYWETDATRTAYFARPLNAASRPSVGLRDREKSTDQYVVSGDGFDPVCLSAPCDGNHATTGNDYTQGFTMDSAHQPSPFFLAALLTGRPYYIWEQMFYAAYSVKSGNPNTTRYGWNQANLGNGSRVSNAWFGHGGALTIYTGHYDQSRAQAWKLREIWLGAAIAPDSSSDAAVFADALRKSDAAMEGWFHVTNGLYPPADPTCAGYNHETSMDPWCVGWKSFGEVVGNGNSDMNIPHILDGTGGSTTVANVTAAGRGRMPLWQHGYLLSVLTWANQAGVVKTNGSPIFQYSRARNALFLSRLVNDTEANPAIISQYFTPVTLVVEGVEKVARDRTDFNAINSIQQSSDGTLQAGINSTDTAIQYTGQTQPGTELTFNWNFSMPIIVLWIESEAVLVCKISADPTAPVGGTVTATACAGGRGALGTTATSHSSGAATRQQPLLFQFDYQGGYVAIAKSSLALTADVSVSGYRSSRAALERVLGFHFQYEPITHVNHGSPIWAFQARRDPSNVRAVGGTGTLTLRYNAPDLGACKYTAAASISDSSDASDTSDSGGPVARTVTVGSLSAGVVQYRISCGSGRVVGAATVQ